MSIAAVPNGSIEKIRPDWDGSLVKGRISSVVQEPHVTGDVGIPAKSGEVIKTKQQAV